MLSSTHFGVVASKVDVLIVYAVKGVLNPDPASVVGFRGLQVLRGEQGEVRWVQRRVSDVKQVDMNRDKRTKRVANGPGPAWVLRQMSRGMRPCALGVRIIS